MHLAVIADVSDAAPVRYERYASREAPRANESQSPADDASQPVGADEERREQVASARLVSDGDSARAAPIVAPHVGHSCLFDDVHTGTARRIEQDCIEHSAPDRESAIAKPSEAVWCGEVAAELPARWRAYHHSRQMRRSTRVDLGEHPYVAQDARRLRTQILRARLVARKALAIDEENLRPGTGKGERSRGSCRPSTNDDDVGVAHAGTRSARQMRPLTRASRWNVPMYRQCGPGKRNTDASRVRNGRSDERESAENMKRG